MYLRTAKARFSVVFLQKQKQEYSSLDSHFIAHSDSYLSNVAAKMNYQLIVALLIVNVVVANALGLPQNIATPLIVPRTVSADHRSEAPT